MARAHSAAEVILKDQGKCAIRRDPPQSTSTPPNLESLNEKKRTKEINNVFETDLWCTVATGQDAVLFKSLSGPEILILQSLVLPQSAYLTGWFWRFF